MRRATSHRFPPVRIAAALRPGAGLLLAAFFLWPPPAIRSQPAPPSEYEVKAALLLNFARLTDWPSNAFASPTAPMVVGVLGRDPFGKLLEKTFSGKTVYGRSFVVKRVTADPDLKLCHLLFVPASEKHRERALLDKLKDAPVLTVGEHEDFLDHGGAVQFLLTDNSVRFSVNLHPAKSTRLRIHARVLRHAITVRGKYE